jgi:molybdenum cofactor biosynthesis protein B
VTGAADKVQDGAMNRIDETKPFKPVNIAVLTVSDTRTLETDKSGDTLVERLTGAGHVLAARAIVTDDISLIRAQVKKWIDDPGIEAVITTGGTGVTGRDVTPEALEALFEKRIDGFGEVFRWISFQNIGTSTMQSRAIAGVANATYIFALPGSTGACRDGWDEILRNQLDIRFRPCNFAELMPRLNEGKMPRSG